MTMAPSPIPPNENFSGEDMFTYTVDDGAGGSASATVAVTVTGVADLPSVAAPPSVQTIDLAPIELNDFVASLVDTDGSETLSISFFGLPAGAVITNPGAIDEKRAQIEDLSTQIDAIQGEIDTAQEDKSTKIDRLKELQDAGGPQEEIDKLAAEIADLEDLIQRKAMDRDVAKNERNILESEANQLTQESGGPDDTLNFAGPGSGYVLQLPDGTTENFLLTIGVAAIEAEPLADPADQFAGRVVAIEVEVLESPTAQNDEASTAEDEAVNIDLLVNDTDSDGDPLVIIEVTQGANGAVVDNGDGTVTYTPALNFSGEDEFAYTISDGNGGTSSATVKVLVGGVADSPDLLTPAELTAIDLAPIPLDNIDPSLVDTDGSESLKVKFGGLPLGAAILNPDAIAEKSQRINDLNEQNCAT